MEPSASVITRSRWLDNTGEALAMVLRPGNAGSNTGADHLLVLERALSQLPDRWRSKRDLVRADGAGYSHALITALSAQGLEFSVGFPVTDAVRDAIRLVPKHLAQELYLNEDFDRILQLLGDQGQVVFYGPPGTGKTFAARKLAGHIARGGGTLEKIQFHTSYSYDDLIEGYRPRLANGQVTYEVVDGPLKRLAATAQERPDVTHVLFINELNRGNVSKILGELLFLLEYRDEETRLLYSDAPFSLPRNLQIVATMNTADRSIALVDTALRRRFRFVPFFPDSPPIDTLLRR